MYGMTVTGVLLQDSHEKIKFFEGTCLLVDTSTKVVLRMAFLAFSNADI